MGKRYHCNYCDKTMVAAPAIVKTHNKGVVHQKLVQEHYQQFKDPETILAEEKTKKPCLRFTKGECKFGGICRYSHYTKEQIESLKEYVAAKQRNKTQIHQPSFEDLYQKLQDEKSNKPLSDEGNTILYDNNGVTHILPWTYNNDFDTYGDNLPPSLRRFKIEDFVNANVTEWG
ncbi:zinc finger matrin-type protein 5 [Galleria mellonella]|uniref:Zinc finger matrin-type protein 5 n=1 Tax=Galleria mellonella TaxID=7137 RepID=A0A6J1X9F0_GALME|nr:zinc finger matrin-type protein 5 [Galleria mellonella]XP_052747772.1 zinc finger matrin-type protein 5 [Galleria mellonella]